MILFIKIITAHYIFEFIFHCLYCASGGRNAEAVTLIAWHVQGLLIHSVPRVQRTGICMFNLTRQTRRELLASVYPAVVINQTRKHAVLVMVATEVRRAICLFYILCYLVRWSFLPMLMLSVNINVSTYLAKYYFYTCWFGPMIHFCYLLTTKKASICPYTQ